MAIKLRCDDTWWLDESGIGWRFCDQCFVEKDDNGNMVVTNCQNKVRLDGLPHCRPCIEKARCECGQVNPGLLGEDFIKPCAICGQDPQGRLTKIQ